MTNVKIIVPVALLIIGLGAGFYGGIQFRNYQISQMRVVTGNGTFRFVGGRNGSGGAGRGVVIGSIISEDDKSITVKMGDGSTKIVILSEGTTYSNTVTASKTDLKVGTTVGVFGATNSDGSVTATTIQLNPNFMRPQTSPRPTQ